MIGRQKRIAACGVSKTLSALVLALVILARPSPGHALSELPPTQAPEAEVEQGAPLPPLEGPLTGPDGGLPDPAPVIRATPETGTPETGPGMAAPEDAAPVEILTDLSALPEPARRMRELILEAAASGDPERLRPLLGIGPAATQLAFGDIEGDPVDYLRSISGDGEGREILAILIDLLHAGFVRFDAGTPSETYVWPYFVALPLDQLTPPQKVDLLRIVTAGDVEDMKAYGGYNFFRAGISAEGEWRFFMAGD